MDESDDDDANLADFERPASPRLAAGSTRSSTVTLVPGRSTRSSTVTLVPGQYWIGSVGWRSGHQDVALRTLAQAEHAHEQRLATLDPSHSIHRTLIGFVPLRRRAMGVVAFDPRRLGGGNPSTTDPWFARRVGRFHVQYRSRVAGHRHTINRVRTEHFATEVERYLGRTNLVWYIIQWSIEEYGTDGLGLI